MAEVIEGMAELGRSRERFDFESIRAETNIAAAFLQDDGRFVGEGNVGSTVAEFVFEDDG